VLDTRLEKLIMHSIKRRAEGRMSERRIPRLLPPRFSREKRRVPRVPERLKRVPCRQVGNFDYGFLIAPIKLATGIQLAPPEKLESITGA